MHQVCCMNCLFVLILMRENFLSCRRCHLWKKWARISDECIFVAAVSLTRLWTMRAKPLSRVKSCYIIEVASYFSPFKQWSFIWLIPWISYWLASVSDLRSLLFVASIWYSYYHNYQTKLKKWWYRYFLFKLYKIRVTLLFTSVCIKALVQQVRVWILDVQAQTLIGFDPTSTTTLISKLSIIIYLAYKKLWYWSQNLIPN